MYCIILFVLEVFGTELAVLAETLSYTIESSNVLSMHLHPVSPLPWKTIYLAHSTSNLTELFKEQDDDSRLSFGQIGDSDRELSEFRPLGTVA